MNAVVATLARFVRAVIVEPIRAGRIRDTGWPDGLRPIVVCATIAFVGAIGLVIAAPLIRAAVPLTVSNGDVTLSLPRILLPIFFALIVLSIALVQTAAVHLEWKAAVPITLFSVLTVLFLGGLDRGFGLEIEFFTPGKIAALATVVTIIAITVIRRRLAFSWIEFVVMLNSVGATAILSLSRAAAATAPYGIDFGPPTATLIMSSLGSLAVPAAMAAGVAAAELAVLIVRALSAAIASRSPVDAAAPPPRTITITFLILSALAVADAVYRSIAAGGPALWSIAGSAIILAGVGGAILLLARVRRSARGAGLGDVLGALGGVLLPVAATLTVILGPVVVILLTAQILFSWGAGPEWAGLAFIATGVAGSATATLIVRTVAAIGFLIAAIVFARRGSTGSPELLTGFGVITLASSATDLLGVQFDWSSESIASVIVMVVVVIAAIAAALRRVTSRLLIGLSTALLLAIAVAWRDAIADPLGALLGASAIAVILFGFVWGFVTGAESTRSTSAAYPAASRVLLFLANSVFGATVLAFAALARNLDVVIDFNRFADFGDVILGTGMLVVAAVVIFASQVPLRLEAPTDEGQAWSRQRQTLASSSAE